MPESAIELYRRLHYQQAFGLDKWLKPLKEHSFRTKFVELSYAEGSALSKSEKNRTAEDLEILSKLAERLDRRIRKFPNGTFVVRFFNH